MSTLDALVSDLGPLTASGHPPVHLWQPKHQGEIDIVIQRDGSWLHEGGLIKREALVKLFSSVLWFEDGQHYLKTPVEQMEITVETTPFLMTQLAVQNPQTPEQTLVLTSSYGDVVVLGEDNPLWIDKTVIAGQEVPLVGVRYGMAGRLTSSILHELAELGEVVSGDEGECLRLLSGGAAFDLLIA
ncbi:MAG: DUF1285 domain-containing protein [Leucothrix sp.]